jgi:hypothetical protein
MAIPESLAPTFVKQFHKGTQSGWKTLETTLAQHFYVPKLSSINKVVCKRCSLCAKNNPWQGPRVLPQVQSIGGTPLENMIMDSIEMPQVQGCTYLLVSVCAFSGWVEAFPTQTEKAQELARCLLKIIPWFGIPVSIGLDNEPAFMAKMMQLVAKFLGICIRLTAPKVQEKWNI